MKWFILIIGIACNASASVLIKMAMMPPRKLPSLTAPFELFYNWPLLFRCCALWCCFYIICCSFSRATTKYCSSDIDYRCGCCCSYTVSCRFQREFLLDIYSGCYLSDSGCVFDYSKSIKLRKCNNG